MKRFAALSIIYLAIFSTHVEAAAELEERGEIEASVLRLFSTEDFRALEELSRSYRSTRSRTSSGLWHLTLFYAGIESAIRQEEKASPRDVAFAELEGKAQRWAAEFPDSPSAHIAYAMVRVARGWSYLRDQPASSVSSEDWEPFRKHIAIAREYLDEHKPVAAVDPQWYEVMVSVARDEGWDYFEFSELIDEAFEREPMFYETYFRAMEYLLPKLYGSSRDIEALARTAAHRTSAAEGDGLYARIYWYASQAEYGDDLFSNTLVDWPLMRDGFEDVIARYPDAWNLNNFARFSCLAHDKDTTRILFNQIKDDFVPEAWRPPSLHTQCSFWLLLP